MKKIATILLVAGAILTAWPAGAQAAGGTSMVCNTTFFESFSPGFTLTPSSGPQYSSSPAPIHCTGTINGQPITGPGTIENNGAYHNSTCLLDNADGSVTISLPTGTGTVTLHGQYKVTRVAAALSVELDFGSSRGEAQAVVVPVKGDCVLNPITEALVLMSLNIHDKPPANLQRSCDLDLLVVQVGCRTKS